MTDRQPMETVRGVRHSDLKTSQEQTGSACTRVRAGLPHQPDVTERGEGFNITHHPPNANQNHKETALHTCQNGYFLDKEITSVGEGVEKRELR